jgi:hypothetical protein
MSQNILFVLYDQHQRHDVCRKVSLHVKSGHKHMQNFNSLINQADIVEQLEFAVSNPKHMKSVKLFKTIMTSIKIAGSSIAYSPTEQAASLSKMYSLVYRFGWPTWFLTIAPDNNNSELIIRIALNGNYDEISKHLLQDNSSLRSKLTAESPVAASVYYHQIINRVFECLIGLPSSTTTRAASLNPNDRPQGVLGKPLCFFAVNEAQGEYAFK